MGGRVAIHRPLFELHIYLHGSNGVHFSSIFTLRTNYSLNDTENAGWKAFYQVTELIEYSFKK